MYHGFPIRAVVGGGAGRRALRRRSCRAGNRGSRQGIAALWLVVTLPVLLMLLIFVVDVANLWLARAEVENSLESAAVAAVKQWGDGGGETTATARQVGVAYAAANHVRAFPLAIADNLAPAATPENPNENLQGYPEPADPARGLPPRGNLVFGAIVQAHLSAPAVFNAGVRPVCPGPGDNPNEPAQHAAHAVRAQAIVPVRSFFGRFSGLEFGPYRVSAAATAVYDCSTRRPRLVRAEAFVAPGPPASD